MPATRTRMAHRNWPLEDRFKAFVEVDDNGCWRWTSVTDDMGRGRFKLNGRMVKAHIAAKEIFDGELAEPGMEAHHTCLNGSCANPAHVVYLTKADHKAEHRRLRLEQATT